MSEPWLAARRFRKKPVVIEAIQYDGTDASISAVAAFSAHVITVRQGVLTIPTLEGRMTANVGDWIVKGIKGEFYPVKPDIFEAMYEPESSHPQPEQDQP